MSGRPNLEQVRARNALNAVNRGVRGRGVQDGDALSGFPALIVNNGLLATLAYAISKRDRGGYREIGDAIAAHLADPLIGLHKGPPTLSGLRDALAAENSAALRLCTAEALAYLNYLRRFAKGQNSQPQNRSQED